MPVAKERGAKPGSGAGRYEQLASAATAAAAAARRSGRRARSSPPGARMGAWSSAYRTLQAAHIKLQTKYDKLKDTKLNGLITEAESYRLELADHGAKAEELIKHFRGEADRQKEAAAGGRRGRVVVARTSSSARTPSSRRRYWRIRTRSCAWSRRRRRRRSAPAEEAAASTSGRWGSEELEAFMGLRWDKQSTGVHHFTHAATGFAFQLSAADPASYADDDDETRERRRREKRRRVRRGRAG